MLNNYLKVMIRSIMRRKVYSAINIFGLTVGIAFALLIGVFVWSELQVNQSLADVDRLYILESRYSGPEENFIWFAPSPLMRQAVEQYPALIENYYRFRDRQITVSKGDNHFRIQSMIGDSTFFQMFGFPILHGDGHAALTRPNSIAITEKIARQYFDRSDVVGESLTLTTEINGLKEFMITAVLADLQQKNSVTDFMNSDAQVFLSLKNKDDFSLGFEDDWTSEIITYAKLAPHASPSEARNAINKILKDGAPKSLSENRTIELDSLKNYYLVTNHSAVQKLLATLTMIVVFILFLAMANFINITVASSFSRLKEVGLRKVIGGIRKQVIVQFLSESVMLALLSGFLSVVLYELLHGYAGEVLGTGLPSIIQFPPLLWMWILVGIFSTGMLAGVYPSFYLSTTETIDSLKGKFKSVGRAIRFTRVLIGAQFLIAIFVFTVAVIISKQVSFFMEKDMGYDKSFLLIVSSLPRQWTEEGFAKMDAAKHEFLKSPRIKQVSLSLGVPGVNFSMGDSKIYPVGLPQEQGIHATLTSADEDFASAYGMKILEGKFLVGEGRVRQPNALVINESAQKALGGQVGDRVKLENWGDVEFTIVGIVKDFNFESLHEAVKPAVFMHNRDYGAFRYFSFKLGPGSLTQSVEEVEKHWKKLFPNDPFVYAFSDEKLQSLYQTEFQLKKASTIAAPLILILVLAGVLGLVALSLSKRNKEFGIRKVVGASAGSILALLSREYVILMALAFTLGVPLTYLFISQWLDGFAYHIDVTWWMFAIPMVILFCITLIVVGAQSVKTALSNPVESLRTE